MAQTGYTPIQLYYSSTTTNQPSTANLANGELAINIADGKLFYKNSGGTLSTVYLNQASGSASGWLSSTDWTTFNNKQPAGTYVTSVTGTAPVVSSGGTTPAISMAAASGSTNGYLTSTDWTTFNNKQPAGSYLTAVTADSPLAGSGTSASHLSIPAATSSVNGYLTSTDWSTFNGKQAALVSGSNIKTVSGTSLLGSGDVGTIGVGYGGTGTATAFTTGSVVFAGASGVYTQNNANLFWDNTNNRLGIGTASPATTLAVAGVTTLAGAANTALNVTSNGGYQKRAIYVLSGATSSAGGIYITGQNASAGNSAAYEAVGQRSDANGVSAFAGNVLLGHLRTDAAISTAGAFLGKIGFGGNPTGTALSNILYSAQIGSVSESGWSSSSAMPTALVFSTGSTGIDVNTSLTEFGSERMRITSAGYVGINTASPVNLLTVNGVGQFNGNIGLNTSTPGNGLSGYILEVQPGNGQSAGGIRVGNYNVTSSTVSFIESFGARNDANGTFYGKFGASVSRQDGTAIQSGAFIGCYAFGAQYGTNTAYTAANLLYPAAIYGVAESAFTASNAMSTAIVFATGSTGNALTSVNVAYGTERFRIDSSGNALVTGVGGLGYGTGSGGAVTQGTSRTTGVTLNKTNGAITLVSAAGSASYQTFTVTNLTVAATDTIIINQKSGTDKYIILVTNIAAGSFSVTFATTGGTTTEQPVFNFAVIKAVTA